MLSPAKVYISFDKIFNLGLTLENCMQSDLSEVPYPLTIQKIRILFINV